MSKLDDELFVKGKQKRKQTRSEKREERRRRDRQEQLQLEGSKDEKSERDKKMKEHHEVDMTAKEMKNLQMADPSLQDVRRMAEKQESKAGVGFFLKDGLLYCRWVSRGRKAEGSSVEQLVLPQKCRSAVMKLAHSIPLAGHLGKNKTVDNAFTGQQYIMILPGFVVAVKLARRLQ